MENKRAPKTFANCYLYQLTDSNGYNSERALLDFIMSAERIDRSSSAFKNIVLSLKARAQSAVLVRMLQQPNLVLGIAKQKELPSSLKIFYARDVRSNSKSRKCFLDVTGLISLQNGYFVCKEIDKFAALLLGVLGTEIYYTDETKLITNGNVQKYSVSSFTKLFTSIIDYFRLPGYMTNKDKIRYITGVYFAYNVMRLSIDQARSISAAANNISKSDADNWNFYYVYEDDFKDISAFIISLAKVFKLKDLTPDVVINKWLYFYGKGTQYALELYPSFLNMILFAYSGPYLNNYKRIESICGRDMVDLTNLVMRIGESLFSEGFNFKESTNMIGRDHYKYELDVAKRKLQTGKDEEAKDIFKAELINESKLKARDITEKEIKSEKERVGTKTNNECDTLLNSIRQDVQLEQNSLISGESFKKHDSYNGTEKNKEVATLVDELEKDLALVV